mgnify:CR=1 FL=1|tara:strand:+ start:2962 stop:5169 length:2208 start_codon:yes stop_codon:yes gene_type:complete
MAKMTYAKIAELLNKQYNKYDKQLQNAVTDAERNSATLMLQRVSANLNKLMLENQNAANIEDSKNPPADSPMQSLQNREMQMAKNGGKLKSIPKNNKGLPKLSKSVRNKMGYMKKGGKTFPDLTGDGKTTYADILKGRGVFGNGGGLWANIHAKRKRGEAPAKPGEKGYPDKKQWDKLTKAMGGSLMMNPDFIPMGTPTMKSGPNLPIPAPRKISIKSPRYFQAGGITPAQDIKLKQLQKAAKAYKRGDNSMEAISARRALQNFIKQELGQSQMGYEDFLAYSPNVIEPPTLLESQGFTPENGYEVIVEPGGTYNGTVYPDGVVRSYFNGIPYDFNVTDRSTIGKLEQPVITPSEPVTGPSKTDPPPAKRGPGSKNKEGLYGDVTLEQANKFKEEAGILTGLGDKFDFTNPEHVSLLQTNMTTEGAFTGDSTLLSEGLKDEIAAISGDAGIFQAGVDGKFGPDTLLALQGFSELIKNNPNILNTDPKEIPYVEPEFNIEPIELDEVTVTADKLDKGDTDGGGGKFNQFTGDKFLGALPGLAKGLEYMNTYNTINSMLPPPNLSLMRPQYLNTDVDISADLNALDEARVLNKRALTDSSTKRNNVLQNLRADEARIDRAMGKLFQNQRNEERKLQNMQTALNAKAADENRKTIFDNNMAQRNFINDRSLAQRDFMSGVVGDVMDLQTQRTNRASQMARLNALAPYLNMYGGYDRYLQNLATQLTPAQLKMMGLTTT